MAASEKRQIVVDLEANNKMGPAAKAAADDLGKIGKAADRAADSAEDLGKASAIAGDSAQKFGREANQAQKHVDQLADEIDKVQRELVTLAAAFTMAGNAADRLDASKAIRNTQNELRRLKTSKGILEGILPDPVPAAKSFIQKLGGAISGQAGQLAAVAGKSPGVTIGAAMGAAAAPVLISAIGSAISAGIGAGGIGAGIALAVSKDKDIQRAGADLGKKFVTGLQDSASKNLSGPIKASMGILAGEADRLVKSWDGAFKALSTSVIPLTQDIVTGVDRINTSVVDVASKSAPALKGLGDSWVLLADGAGDALDVLSDGSVEAAGNLTLLAGATADLMKISANTIGVLGKLSNEPLLTGGLLPILRDHYIETAESSKTFTSATQGVINALTVVQRAAIGAEGAMSELNTELKAQADPVFALRESQIKLAEAQDASAKAIKKHGANSKEAKEATRNLAKAALDLQGNVGKLGKDFDGKLTPAMRASLKAAGLTKGQINAVEKEFGEARKAGNAYAKTYASNVKVNGAPQARKMLYTVKQIIDGIPRAVSISMRITGVSNVSKARAAVLKNTRASGGPVKAGEPYWVGEEGPELIMPTAAGHVINATKSRMMSRAAPVGPGAPSTRRAVAAALGSATASTAVPTIRVDVTGAEGKFKAWIRELYRTGQLP